MPTWKRIKGMRMSGARKYKGTTNILSNKERVQVGTLKFSEKGHTPT
jgi:hypothetical protein